MRKPKRSMLESIPMLILLGVLAGVVGGVGVGLFQLRAAESSASAAASGQ